MSWSDSVGSEDGAASGIANRTGCVCSRQGVLFKFSDIHALHPLARPGRFTKERETRFDARIVEEAAHRQATGQLSPPMPLDQCGHDSLQRNAVQRIAGMGDRIWLSHAVTV